MLSVGNAVSEAFVWPLWGSLQWSLKRHKQLHQTRYKRNSQGVGYLAPWYNSILILDYLPTCKALHNLIKDGKWMDYGSCYSFLDIIKRMRLGGSVTWCLSSFLFKNHVHLIKTENYMYLKYSLHCSIGNQNHYKMI